MSAVERETHVWEEGAMRAKHLEMRLMGLTGLSAGEIDQRVRPLRDLDLIPTTGRGRHVPHIGPAHAAAIVLALVSRRAIDSGTVARRAGQLKAVDREGRAFGGATLLTAIAFALSDPKLSDARTSGDPLLRQGFERIEVAEDGSAAWMHFRVGSEALVTVFADDPKQRQHIAANPDAYDAFGNARAERRFIIGGGFLRQLAHDLGRSDESRGGWGTPAVGKTEDVA